MKAIKLNIYVTLAFAGLFLLSSPVEAQYYSQSEVKSSIVVDKLVRPINDSKFYDNVDSSLKVFSEGEQIEYKILVKNSGNSDIANLKFTDQLPSYLSLQFFPGEYNKDTNKITATIDKLAIGETKEYLIRARIANVPAASVCGNKIKLVNEASVVASALSDSDTASLYVDKPCIPSTGSADLMTKSGLIIVGLFTALGLRKLARGY